LAARELVAVTGAGWHQLHTASALARDVAAAVRAAVLQRRPQVVAVPQDLLYVDVDELLLTDVLPGQLPSPVVFPAPPTVPGPGDLDRTVGVLRASRRPVVVAGRGVVEAAARARGEVAALAHHLGAPLATSLLGRGLFADDPAHVGIFGGLASPYGSDVLPTADLVLAFGCSLNPWTTMQGELLDGATVVHVDVDPEAIGRWAPPDIGLVGDAGAVTESLLSALSDDAPRAAWAPPPSVTAGKAVASSGGLSTVAVAEALSGRLPEDCTVVLDSGHAVLEALPHIVVPSPERFVFGVHAGAIGQGLGLAIGASMAADEWTVLVLGDGALSMALQELDTVRQHRLPLLVVVLDDGGYGAEVHYAAAHGLPEDHAATDNPDYGAVAEAFGFRAHRVEALEDLEVVTRVLTGEPVPTLLHVPVAGRPMSRWYEAFTAGVARVGWTGGS
jgi:acetolactate synthase-1/2/3 large subunit